jgi:hypothetical protein
LPIIIAIGNRISERLSDYVKKYTFEGKLSDEVKESLRAQTLSDYQVRYLPKYPKYVQNKIAKVIEAQKLTGRQALDLTLLHDKNPSEDLYALSNEVKGVKKVKIDLDQLSPEARAEVERRLKDAKAEAREKLGVSQDSLNPGSILTHGTEKGSPKEMTLVSFEPKVESKYPRNDRLSEFRQLNTFVRSVATSAILLGRNIIVGLATS